MINSETGARKLQWWGVKKPAMRLNLVYDTTPQNVVSISNRTIVYDTTLQNDTAPQNDSAPLRQRGRINWPRHFNLYTFNFVSISNWTIEYAQLTC